MTPNEMKAQGYTNKNIAKVLLNNAQGKLLLAVECQQQSRSSQQQHLANLDFVIALDEWFDARTVWANTPDARTMSKGDLRRNLKRLTK